ncbi:SoxR reducing system RseC family protein [Aliidiomarina celeris]|uniref:SoxR reducing system RseC family protein n=1 Tax=Aliidiomarina celeris TaxID=2249428 RepID=UPI000DEA9D5F|nr:SoxR reducing system RseC family protein [Aliidiomarina celeris]
MIREVGEVIAQQEGWLQVKTALKQGCSGCQHQNHCGAGLLAKALPKRDGIVHVPANGEFKVGDRVELHLPEQVMVRFSMLLYGLPLLGLVFGAGLASWLFPGSEPAAIFTAFGAMAVSFWVIRRYLQRRDIKIKTCLEVQTLPHL